jgi:hypothetical protein
VDLRPKHSGGKYRTVLLVSVPSGGSLGYFLPMYANGADFNDLHNLFPSSGSIDLPVLRINGEAPTVTEGFSWGCVKALYQD